MNILSNPLLITAVQFVWGLVVKYHPAWGKVPNAIIPWVNAILALIMSAFGGGAAAVHPASFVPAAFVAASFWGSLGFLTPVLSAGWSAIQTSLIYEVFGRSLVEKVGLKPNA